MREKCYSCMRPKSSCMCSYISARKTNAKFVFLMHPHEHRKIKNGTGRLTHLQLKNSEIIVDINFSHNKKLNQILNDTQLDPYLLYPGKGAVNLSTTRPKLHPNKKIVIIVIDATWLCAKKILKLSKNLHDLPRLSFNNTKLSDFVIKQQPDKYCLSTIESTKLTLELLIKHNIENCDLSDFLLPFEKMIEYQIECIKKTDNKLYRGKSSRNLRLKNHYRSSASHALLFEKDNY